MKQASKRSYIVIIASVLVMAILCVGTLVKPDVEFSENENRYLQQVPVLNMDSLFSGRFGTQAESYLNDQIIGRDFWVQAMARAEALIGITDINGVYLCEDGRVVTQVTAADFNWSQFVRNLKQIKDLEDKLAGTGTTVHTMLLPTAGYVYQDVLPGNAMWFDEDGAFAEALNILGGSFIDTREDFENAEFETFFRTDHHWTNYGSFLGYKAFCEAAGQKESPAYDESKMQILSEEFLGTLYSKVLLDSIGKDTVVTPQAALDATYTVTMEGKTYDSLYFNDFLEKKDKYAVYFGGNYDKVDIITEAEGEKLLIIKDSMANSFVPYLLEEYSEITMVDSRYYRDSIEELATEYDKVLVLYGIDNFAGEKISLTSALMQ